MSDPFLITGPALVSFSGGRTSAYMLWRILQAHGGTLPEDVKVYFANAGKEREETLRFVHECASRWSVNIVWLEWRPRPEQVDLAAGRHARADIVAWMRENAEPNGYAAVGFNSACRSGEPFSALIASRGYVPNAQDRFCSANLKIRPMERFAQDVLGWTHWRNAVGLRHDEGYRCVKAYARNAAKKDRHSAVLPMDKGRITESDVLTFWLGPTMRPGGETPQGFDLGLYSYEGNCDLCFLKRRAKRAQLVRDDPAMADWWIHEEQSSCANKLANRQFKQEETYAELRRAVLEQPIFDFDAVSSDDEHDTECGLLCDTEVA